MAEARIVQSFTYKTGRNFLFLKVFGLSGGVFLGSVMLPADKLTAVTHVES